MIPLLDKYLIVNIDGNHYSVSCVLGLKMTVHRRTLLDSKLIIQCISKILVLILLLIENIKILSLSTTKRLRKCYVFEISLCLQAFFRIEYIFYICLIIKSVYLSFGTLIKLLKIVTDVPEKKMYFPNSKRDHEGKRGFKGAFSIF